VGTTDSLVTIGKWSDGVQRVVVEIMPEKNQKRLSPGGECDFCCEWGSHHVELG